MCSVNWINCISNYLIIMKCIMYSTNPINPGKEFI